MRARISFKFKIQTYYYAQVTKVNSGVVCAPFPAKCVTSKRNGRCKIKN